MSYRLLAGKRESLIPRFWPLQKSQAYKHSLRRPNSDGPAKLQECQMSNSSSASFSVSLHKGNAAMEARKKVEGHPQGIVEAAAPEPSVLGDETTAAISLALYHPQPRKDIWWRACEEGKRKEADLRAKTDKLPYSNPSKTPLSYLWQSFPSLSLDGPHQPQQDTCLSPQLDVLCNCKQQRTNNKQTEQQFSIHQRFYLS